LANGAFVRPDECQREQAIRNAERPGVHTLAGRRRADLASGRSARSWLPDLQLADHHGDGVDLALDGRDHLLTQRIFGTGDTPMNEEFLEQALKDGRILDLQPDPSVIADTFSPDGNNVRYVSAGLAAKLMPFGIVHQGSLLLSSVAGILAYLSAGAPVATIGRPRTTLEHQRALGDNPEGSIDTQPKVTFELAGGEWVAQLAEEVFS